MTDPRRPCRVCATPLDRDFARCPFCNAPRPHRGRRRRTAALWLAGAALLLVLWWAWPAISLRLF